MMNALDICITIFTPMCRPREWYPFTPRMWLFKPRSAFATLCPLKLQFQPLVAGKEGKIYKCSGEMNVIELDRVEGVDGVKISSSS